MADKKITKNSSKKATAKKSQEPLLDKKVTNDELDAANATIQNLESDKKDLELKNAKLKENAPTTTTENVQAVTNTGNKQEIQSATGYVDLENKHGHIIARRVPKEEAQKRINKDSSIKVIQKETENGKEN